MNNILKLPLSPSYYLRHPFHFVSSLAWLLKNASERLKLGYCEEDVWNIDNWFLNTIPPMLRELTKGEAYPITDDKIKSIEEWRDLLLDMAAKFESAKESEQEKKNEYWPQYRASKGMDQEIRTKYWERTAELFEEGRKNFHEAMDNFIKYFFYL